VNSGLLDPLAWTQSQDDLSGAADNQGDAENPLLPVVAALSSGLSTRKDLVDEIGIGGRVDIMAASGWRAFSFDSSAFRRDLVQALDDAHAFDSKHESIIAGTRPLRNLLSGLDLADQNESGERGRGAELGPLERSSSLALVATLWTVPSGVRYSPAPGDQPGSGAIGSLEAVKQGSSWKTYLMALDRAFERTYRDICQKFATESGSLGGAPSGRDSVNRLEWHGPLIPLISADWIGNCQGAPRGGGQLESGSGIAPGETERVEPAPAAGEAEGPTAKSHDLHPGAEARRAAPAVLPVLSIFASSSLAAGWLWARHLRSPKRRAASTGSAATDQADGITRTD